MGGDGSTGAADDRAADRAVDRTADRTADRATDRAGDRVDDRADDRADGDAQRTRARDDQRRRRPTGARRPARRPDPAQRPAVRVRRLLGLSSTRRAAVLALVVCAVVLSVAVPLRDYLAQRGTLEETVRQQDSLREQVDSLEQRRAELSDPAHIEAEARERLRYVKPGETPYVVQLPTTTPPPATAETPRSAPGDEWYEQLWRSVAPPGQAADGG